MIELKNTNLVQNFKKNLPTHTQEHLKTIHNALKQSTSRAYFVGGAVRDFFQNIHDIHDIDIEVYDIDAPSFDALMLSIGASGIGKSFFVYKLGDIDISLARTESKTGKGHQGFSVSIAEDEKEATKRRDFTINAMMINIFTGDFLDFHHGYDDLQAKTLRMVDKIKFQEDSLRVLRAMQFSARFAFKIDDTSLNIMKNIDVSDLSLPRITWEFEKMFNGKYLHYGLYYFLHLGISKKIFNLELSHASFFQMARFMLALKANIPHNLHPYIFIYALYQKQHISPSRFINTIALPNHYSQFFKYQKRIPTTITPRFLAALSLKIPLNQWLGCYRCISKASILHLYKHTYESLVTSQQVIDDGFKNAGISREIKRRKLAHIKQHFTKIP